MPDDNEPGSAGSELGLRAVDVHVGARICAQRTRLGMSRERLAAALELTSRQVQAYEIGMYRVDGTRLFEFARVLKVTVGFFFGDTVKSHNSHPPAAILSDPGDPLDIERNDLASHLAGALCFASDTLVATRSGDRQIEDLLVGDQLLTVGDGISFTTVERIWRRPTGLLRRRAAEIVSPVRIRQGAFPGNIPQRDLLASRSDHVCLRGEMVPVASLASPDTCVPESPGMIADYVFMLVSPNSPVFAEGLPIGRPCRAATRVSRAGEYVVY